MPSAAKKLASVFQYPLMDRLGWKLLEHMFSRGAGLSFQYPLMDRLGWKRLRLPVTVRVPMSHFSVSRRSGFPGAFILCSFRLFLSWLASAFASSILSESALDLRGQTRCF